MGSAGLACPLHQWERMKFLSHDVHHPQSTGEEKRIALLFFLSGEIFLSGPGQPKGNEPGETKILQPHYSEGGLDRLPKKCSSPPAFQEPSSRVPVRLFQH